MNCNLANAVDDAAGALKNLLLHPKGLRDGNDDQSNFMNLSTLAQLCSVRRQKLCNARTKMFNRSRHIADVSPFQIPLHKLRLPFFRLPSLN